MGANNSTPPPPKKEEERETKSETFNKFNEITNIKNKEEEQICKSEKQQLSILKENELS